MRLDITRQASALNEHIQTQFREGHRRALTKLLTLAALVESRGIDAGLVDALRAIGNALEQHMFKEEMWLFPMMEQGGNTLIGRLIDDLHREHVMHEHAMDEFRARLRSLDRISSADPALAGRSPPRCRSGQGRRRCHRAQRVRHQGPDRPVVPAIRQRARAGTRPSRPPRRQ
jgi:regulator of cell morphogenesis and NO signaling